MPRRLVCALLGLAVGPLLLGSRAGAQAYGAWGTQVRADLALELHRHAGLVPTVRATYLPSYRTAAGLVVGCGRLLSLTPSPMRMAGD